MGPDILAALTLFGRANVYSRRAGFLEEVGWHRRSQLSSFTETDFLRESAWVILCSGFRERVIRAVFAYISLCFCDWESASSILEADPACRIAAMASFRNRAKLEAIVGAARHVESQGFAAFKEAVLADPIGELRRLPHIGPITVRHLAKNLGLDVAKPDRHLQRLATQLAFHDTDHLCATIAKVTGEQSKVVDLIFWRYVVDHPKCAALVA